MLFNQLISFPLYLLDWGHKAVNPKDSAHKKRHNIVLFGTAAEDDLEMLNRMSVCSLTTKRKV